MEQRSGRDRWTVWVEEPTDEERTPDAALAAVVTAVTRLALDAEPERLHLHGAALSRAECGVLISAPSGTGKSTLALALIRSGWRYVSDEMTAIGGDELIGFPKPIVVDATSSALVGGLEDARVSLDVDDGEWCVPASWAGAELVSRVEPTLIVLLERTHLGDPVDPPTVAMIHPADAVVTLMGQTLDAQRFGPNALAVLARLAARCRCVRMTVGPLDQCVEMLDELVGGPNEPTEVRELAPITHAPDDAEWCVPDNVRSVLVGDRAVIHDTVDGTIVALDESGTAVWLALHDEPPVWWDSALLTVAGTTEFLGQLAAHGLLDPHLSSPAPA